MLDCLTYAVIVIAAGFTYDNIIRVNIVIGYSDLIQGMNDPARRLHSAAAGLLTA
jgi:hypothetical protein